MLKRTIFAEEHNLFRDSVRKFVEQEITPHHLQWEEDGVVPRDLWRKAGAAGLLCADVPEAYGGPDCDFLFNVVVTEELGRGGFTGPGFSVHSDMASTYVANFGSEEQKQRWLPGMVTGDVICAIAMTEPQAGSDLHGIRTRAVRDGDDWVINGQKVYISNGQLCDLIVVAAKTNPDDGGDRGDAGGISLFLVEADREGFARGSNLKKLGMKAQDTSEMFFEDVRIPAANMLGAVGQGMGYLTSNLARERLVQAVRSAAVIEAVLEWTVDYTAEREAFGRTIGSFQNTQFKLAEVKTEIVSARCFVDRCIELYLDGELGPVEAAMAKLKLAELQGWVVDQCLQFFGGAGYMWEYPITRAYADARVVRIAGGAVEVMKLIIGRDLFRDRLKKPS